ncbi:MAG: SDR family oxidoreductase [Deltaproteobacteria bacterium]|nr:SDR family oxidoreductase [Deltaproteobacteria bacterium]
MARVVITGGGGFIGSNLAHALVARGDSVAVVDNFSTGRKANLADLHGRVDVFEGDIRDRSLLAHALRGAQFVLHQAALPSVARSMEAPEDCHDVNVNGTLYVLEAARAAGVQRLVFAASSSAYGETPQLPKVETMAPSPISPYGASKLFGETYCQIWTRCFGLPCVALRYFNVFGPRQSPDNEYAAVIPRFVTRMQHGQPPTVFGDGGQTRDFCYIDNVVEANLKALAAPAAPGNVYNVACGERVSLLDLVAEINRQLGTAVAVEHLPARAGDIRDSLADIAAARRDLGYTAGVPFAEGLRRAIAWYAAHPNG